MGRVRWRDRSKVERVEWQSRVSLRVINWVFFLAWSGLGLVGSIRGDATATTLFAALMAVNVAQCVVADRHVRLAIDQYLGRGRVPRAWTAAGFCLALASVGLIAALAGTQSVKHGMIVMPLIFAPMPFGGAYALQVPIRTFVRRAVALLAVGIVATAVIARPSPGWLATLTAMLALALGIALLCYRCSIWNLSVMWESEHAREIEARLAVAEERLRFGRDLHDVMGRNLSVVALKSELAVQLARRGRTEDAVAQMIEVQRIAQESQKEVREVVRGYRAADLAAELAGARGVLGAAGIACTVTGGAPDLPADVQSALGWVVRETTTNVLRHGDARTCRVTLAAGGGDVVLTVENDGVDPSGGDGRPGSGLAGLRERLAEVAGTLEAGVVERDRFRVVATVPVRAVRGGGSGAQEAPEPVEAGTASRGGAR
ncbi:sensor histidine kinase [Streptomyces xanthii]|uniref:sensor histidine kinase n=1 Tax=Streptomyces xanthii TaxID=2768069 RepID=UPI001CB77302|nr:histidine kinase [Streptomyces xanthii]